MISRSWQSILLALALLASAMGSGAVSAAEESEFTLSLKNSDIHSLIGTVSKLTGRNFVVDPRVKAKVTVISSQPMAADELYEVFLSVLQVHGFSAVPSGDVIKIVPDVSAKQGPVPSLSNIAERDQLVTHVIRIDNVPAAQLVPILRPLVPQQGHLAAYASTNSLVITDRSANIKRLISIIKRIDRPDNEEIEFVRLLHASATEVVRILNSLQKTAAAARGPSAPGSIRLAADERTNSILISGDRTSRLRMRGLIASLDTPLESGGNTKVVYLKYANATDMVTILKGVSAGQAKVGATTSPTAGSGAAAATAQAQAAAATVRRRSAAASDGKTSVDIQGDEQTNALIITAPPDEMRNILAVVRQLDIRRAQVLVEAIIAEISDGKSREMGVSFVADGRGSDRPISFSNLGSGVDQAIAISSGVATTVGAGLSLALGDINGKGTDFGFLVRAIASDAANNILSTPSLVTLDNEEAEIVVGQNVPFVTGSTTSSSNDNPFQTIERQDVGLTLTVKPQINEGNTIKMEIEQEVSSIDSSAEATADIITKKRSIKTTVLVDSGQTLVLGGLIEETLRDTQEKVPLLGDIPFIGRLFQFRSTVKAKQNLMVFLHPTILSDRNTADYYSSEKYTYLRSRQLVADEEGIGLLEGETPVLPEIEMLFQGASLLFRPPTKSEPFAETSGQRSATGGTDVDSGIEPDDEKLTVPTERAAVSGTEKKLVMETVATETVPEPEVIIEPEASVGAAAVASLPAVVSVAAEPLPMPDPEPAAVQSIGQIGDGEMAKIQRLRIGVGPQRTRIVFDIDRDAGKRVERVFNPDGSISVTLAKTRLGSGFAVPDTEIDKIRQMVVDQQDDTVYIHLVPTDAATFTYQTLQQNGAGNYRFLIDVKFEETPAGSQDG